MPGWLKQVMPEDATGKLAKLYKGIEREHGVEHIILGHSLVPNALDSLLRYYKGVMHGENDLPYMEREMVAVTVSVLNRCHY
jgi:alkylhydroperoxidase family enzyme